MNVILARNIRILRKSAGYTTAFCALSLGVTETKWKGWEDGSTSFITAEQILKIAKLLQYKDIYKMMTMPMPQTSPDYTKK